YRNVAPDTSGYGEGQVYVGNATVTTDSSGNAIFGFAISGIFTNRYFAATATDVSTGDTSEFNQAMVAAVGSGAPALSGPYSLNGSGITWKLNNLQAGRAYRLQASTNLLSWIDVTNFLSATTNLIYTDATGTNFQRRFYRAVSP